MTTKAAGWIVVAKNYGEPLELCFEDDGSKEGILLRADVTLFSTRQDAQDAIKRTIKRFKNDTANRWNDPDNFQIWRVRK